MSGNGDPTALKHAEAALKEQLRTLEAGQQIQAESQKKEVLATMSGSKEFIIKDSGERRQFSTGSVRDMAAGKGRFDLIPPGPLRRLAQHYESGALKYKDRNWEKGLPLHSFIDSALRHLVCLMAGEPDEDHAAAVAWNAFGFMWTLTEIEAGRLPKELDDRPPPEPQYSSPTRPS